MTFTRSQDRFLYNNAPDDEIMKGKIKDPRYPESKWKKVEHTHERPDETTIDIHYWENRTTGEKQGFKFKNN